MKEMREIEGKLLSDRQGQLHVGSEAAVKILEGDPAVTSLFDGPVLPAYQTGSVVTSIPAY